MKGVGFGVEWYALTCTAATATRHTAPDSRMHSGVRSCSLAAPGAPRPLPPSPHLLTPGSNRTPERSLKSSTEKDGTTAREKPRAVATVVLVA
eukprot:1302400-Rhodomonas_salina.1